MMRILLHGFYGHSNFGDDLLLRVMLEQLGHWLPDASISLLLGPGIDAQAFPPSLHATLEGRIVRDNTLKERLAVISQHDMLLWGGGTCLHEHGQCGFSRNIMAAVLGKKVIWLGIGADEVRRYSISCLRARAALASCSRIFVRDQESLDLLRERFGVRDKAEMTADLAWLYQSQAAPAARHDSMCVAWSDVYQTAEEQTELEQRVVETIVGLCVANGWRQVTIVAMANGLDAEPCKRLGEALGRAGLEAIVRQNLGYDEKLDLLRVSGFLLSSRLHPHMVRKLEGLPSLAIGRTLKMRALDGKMSRPLLIAPAARDFTAQIKRGTASELTEPAIVEGREAHIALAMRSFERLKEIA